MEILKRRLLSDFRHGFTTRRGGSSRGPFEGMNLGGAVGDDPARVEANWAELVATTGLAFARVRQVHGCRVLRARGPTPSPVEEGDAVLSVERGLAACVSVADCVPVLLADPRSGAVAAAHAGWRGTLERVAGRAVEELVRQCEARPGDILAAIGPSIGPCCYEVAADLAERFRAEFGPSSANPQKGQPRLDLWLANELALRAAGLSPRHVEVLSRCTACEPETFFSHRRDAGRTGRQVGFIAPFLD